jgi:hypothetical protein
MREIPASNRAERHSADLWQSGREYIVKVLGPKPDVAGRTREAWERAATAIERYRSCYAINPEEATALGREPPAGQFEQRLDRRRTALDVLDARERLGLSTQPAAAIDERILAVPGLLREPEPDRPSDGSPRQRSCMASAGTSSSRRQSARARNIHRTTDVRSPTQHPRACNTAVTSTITAGPYSDRARATSQPSKDARPTIRVRPTRSEPQSPPPSLSRSPSNVTDRAQTQAQIPPG